MILTVTLNPCIDLALFVEGLDLHDSNKVKRSESDAGGKGVNLSRMVTELGGDTIALGLLGGMTGDHVAGILKSKKVPHEFVPIEGETRTNVSVESGDGPPTVFNAAGPEITGIEWENLIGLLARHIKPGVWLALGGSLPPGVPRESYRLIGDLAKSAGALLLLDADKDALTHGLESGPDMVKPNQDEAERLLGREIKSVAEAFEAAKDVRKILLEKGSENPTVVISLGSRGAVLFNGEELLFGVPPLIQTKSTIGSGDSFLGGYLVGWQRSLSVRRCLEMGVAAGSATAQSDGTRLGTHDEVEDALPAVFVLSEADAVAQLQWD